MDFIGTPIDLTKYRLDDRYNNYISEYVAKSPENLQSRNNQNRFFLKRNLYSDDLHIGEALAFFIGKNLNFNMCDIEIYKSPLLKPGVYDLGIKSYVALAEDDIIVSPERIIKLYLESKGEKFDPSKSLDVDTIIQSMFFYVQKYNRPYQEFLDFKQEFINMLVYDARFMIPDRNRDNCFFRLNKKSRILDLYPMFDNEAILGFGCPPEKLSNKTLEELDEENKMAIVTPFEIYKKEKYANYKDVINYIKRLYPKETKKALKMVSKISEKDLEEFFMRVENVSEIRKTTTIDLLSKRKDFFDKTYEEKQGYIEFNGT